MFYNVNKSTNFKFHKRAENNRPIKNKEVSNFKIHN